VKRPPLRIGIAGLGYGTQVYVPAIECLPDARLCALASRRAGSEDDAATSAPVSARRYVGGLTMIEDASLDCVVVATPPEAQADLVRVALQRGVAVLCEKPCGATPEQCAELAACADESDACAAVGFQYRYEPGIAGLIGLVRNGEIGAVEEVSVVWRTRGGLNPRRSWSWRDDAARGGGVLNEFCTHVFDYLSLLSGAAIDRVRCTARTIVTERRDKNGTATAVLAPDDVEFECISENGVSAHACISNAWPEAGGHHIQVRGDRGTARFDHAAPFSLGSASLTVETNGKPSVRPLPLDASFEGLDSRCPAAAAMMSDFLRTVRGEARPRLATVPDCLAARQCIDAAERSEASGQWVSRQSIALHA
jgi:predicted dehydrogenase